jgi:hypothetical protein
MIDMDRIRIEYRCDGAGMVVTFDNLADARVFACKHVGPDAILGEGRAVSRVDDGWLQCSGCQIEELFQEDGSP